jgi:hypothetical protein
MNRSIHSPHVEISEPEEQEIVVTPEEARQGKVGGGVWRVLVYSLLIALTAGAVLVGAVWFT